MNQSSTHPFRLRRRAGAAAVIGTAIVAAILAAVALAAKTTVLRVAKNAPVTNQSGTTTHENILVNHRGFAVYLLTGDSKHHPKCTKATGCFAVWPPATVSSARNLGKAAGIHGKLTVWKRDGFIQLVLAGHPLYRYAPDVHKQQATGEGIQSFGGTWHVLTAAGSPGGGSTKTVSTPTTTSTPTMTCTYPPCY